MPKTVFRYDLPFLHNWSHAENNGSIYKNVFSENETVYKNKTKPHSQFSPIGVLVDNYDYLNFENYPVSSLVLNGRRGRNYEEITIRGYRRIVIVSDDRKTWNLATKQAANEHAKLFKSLGVKQIISVVTTGSENDLLNEPYVFPKQVDSKDQLMLCSMLNAGLIESSRRVLRQDENTPETVLDIGDLASAPCLDLLVMNECMTYRANGFCYASVITSKTHDEDSGQLAKLILKAPTLLPSSACDC